MGIWKMKCWILKIFFIIGFSGCTLSDQNGRFTNSSVQKVDMGKFKGLKIIEIASLNYPDLTAFTPTKQLFTEIDKDNFSESLIQSLKKSDVRVLPSAQTKVHIDFTQLDLLDGETARIMSMSADVAISRNGIITRQTFEIDSKTKTTIGATKDNGVKLFIQKLGEMLREQSSFKR
jgi:hypothetical protein